TADLGWRAYLLALLGRRDEAERALQVHEQFDSTPELGSSFPTWQVYVAVGRFEPVFAGIERLLKDERFARANALELRYGPELEPMRGQPRFDAILQRLPPEKK